MKKGSIAIFLVIFGCFIGIVLFSDFLGNYLGETAENIALVVIALVLVLLLFQSNRKSGKQDTQATEERDNQEASTIPEERENQKEKGVKSIDDDQ